MVINPKPYGSDKSILDKKGDTLERGIVIKPQINQSDNSQLFLSDKS